MKKPQLALIYKDIRGITANRSLFLALLIVPLVMTVVVPSALILTVALTPIDSPETQKLLNMISKGIFGENLQILLIQLILNNIVPLFFLLIPIMAATVMAASSFVGEKEKRTLETLLYCPLSLKQIFYAKVFASFALSQFVSLVSFIAMVLVVQTEIWFVTGTFMLPGLNWLVLLLLVSPAVSLVAITMIVRGSAKAKSVEESQQRSVFLILPILMLVVGQFTGIVMIDELLLLGLGAVNAVAGMLLLRGSSANFNYERLIL